MLPQLYHSHQSRYQEDIPFWIDLAGKAGDPVLELGCGTGRVLIPLAQAGFRVTGLDYSQRMLEYLRSSLDEIIKPRACLVRANMGRFGFAPKLALVILPCNTFSTLSANQRELCLDCIHASLKPKGMFAVSVPNPNLLQKLPAQSEAELEDEFLHPDTGYPVQVSSAWLRTRRTFTVSWSYDHLMPDGLVEHLVVKSIHYMTSLHTYLQEMQAAGLVVKEIYGDFNQSPYKEDAPHLIIVCMRP